MTRRHFQPPRPRQRRAPRPWFPEDWRARVPPTIYRALAAAVMLASPALEDRLGDVALAGALIGLAILFGIGAYLVYRSEAQISWPLPAIDAVTVLSVVPAALVASSLAIADTRVGGGWGPVLAAAIASGCALIVALAFAVLTTSMAEAPGESAALAFLPGPLIVAALVLGAGQFGAHDAALGLSAALMIAGLATLSDGMVGVRLRSLLPVGWFVLFVGAVAAVSRGAGSTSAPASTTAIALLLTAIAGALLMAAPTMATWVNRQRRRRIRPGVG